MFTIRRLAKTFSRSLQGVEGGTVDDGICGNGSGNGSGNRNGNGNGSVNVISIASDTGKGKGPIYDPVSAKISLQKDLIIAEVGENAYSFIHRYVDVMNRSNLFLSTTSRFNVLNRENSYYESIVNLKRVNDIRRINKFFEAVNERLPKQGLFIGRAETYSLRKRRILCRLFPPFNWLHYTFDFAVKRVMPKLKLTQKLYFFFSRGQNRVLSMAETFGRLYSCGFKVEDRTVIDGNLYFVARKTGKPAFDYNPTYGPVVSLNRIGKNGSTIRVFKMRTMHAYSEYLQSYVYDHNHLNQNGKFENDFRVTTLGRIMRKVWIDELPMLYNWLRGDMKLVGVRPLSMQYYNLYDEDLKQKRIRYKPGLVPPYYADLPGSFREIQESERKYLERYDKKPLRTDWQYFWKAMKNILLKNARSS